MKILHHVIERTPFGVQETFTTDGGRIELWGNDSDGFQWRFIGEFMFPHSDKKNYPNRPSAFAAATAFVEGDRS